MVLAPGTMVNANVRLVELLGEGGMGSVWLADHLGLEARVAVKFIASGLVDAEPTMRERFKREASICARLRSIHVVQTFDHGVMDDNVPYIVMELLEGCTLTELVEQQGPLPPREVAMLVAQVTKALHRAHVLGIIHRDVKPDNIFLTDSDYEMFVKVLDFGIAKQTRATAKDVAITKTGTIVGTPEFMSPEQAISAKNIDYRADLFSLAVVAYYALTGELPFEAVGDEPFWLQMTNGLHIPLRDVATDLPSGLDDWMTRALQPQPDDRFQSARLMANAFAEAVDPDAASQIVDELSSADQPSEPRRSAPTAQESHPAMYDLLGPESEDVSREATVLMNQQDHQLAEAEGEGPPTQRRPQPAAPIARAGVYRAVRSGAYNAGVAGAFNTVRTFADEPPAPRPLALPTAAEPLAMPLELPRTPRLLLMIIAALALAAIAAAIAYWSS